MKTIKRALISVSDKTGIAAFVQALAEMGVEIISTGGTAKTLKEQGIPVVEIEDHTGFPEMMGGRLKTLHPKVHGGILGRRDNLEDTDAMLLYGIGTIDLVVVNLYAFEATVAAGANFSTCIENIDIGGPAMLRSAAKNHEFVTAVVDPSDYGRVIGEMRANDGGTTLLLRRELAEKIFWHTSHYDLVIARYMFAKRRYHTHAEGRQA